MRILGIDPGLRFTGYGLVEAATSGMTLLEAGMIRTDPRQPLPRRLQELHDGLLEVLAEGLPDAVALEDLFSHHGFPRTAIIMGHVCGVISLGAAQSGVPIEAIPPAAIKRAIVGSGRGGKRQIQRMVRVLLGLTEEPGAHVGDAIAIALVALSRRGASLASRRPSASPRREISGRDGALPPLARGGGGRA
jgi:crossover junction endodeoxyribonuclease RuvC